MAYTIEHGVIRSNDGLPCGPRWFCDSRVAFQADDDGIADIHYFSPQGAGHTMVFHRAFWGGIRLYLCDETHNYQLRPKGCDILPFGYTATVRRTWDPAFGCELSLFTAGDSVYIQLRTDDALPEGLRLKLEFYKEYQFVPYASADPRYKHPVPRAWEDWDFADGLLATSFTEQGTTTGIAIGGDLGFTYHPMEKNGKIKLISRPLVRGHRYATVAAFAGGRGEAAEKCRRDSRNADAVRLAMEERYRRAADKAPVLESAHPALNEFFALAPLYHEALKVPEIPGAMRAQTTCYWIWGWDSMTTGDAAFYWGDGAFMERMLGFMRDYSDGTGIAHAFGRDMSNIGTAAPSAQGMYITLLQLAQMNGVDIRPYYTFAVQLFRMIQDTEKEGRGLCAGTSLYPDHRALINETGNDLSTFNNAVGYCAARSMTGLALRMGDEATARAADEFARRIEAGFPQLFDEAVGFYDSSIEADTGEKRRAPSNNAVKWENNYCGELTDAVAGRCLAFYERELVAPAGLRPYPVWSSVYDLDSNQLHCWWPVMSEFYTRLANRYDRPDLLRQWGEWVEGWTRRLMCPEGISCYADEAMPPFDNWNCQPGIWHGYSMRGWYTAAVHSVVGVDLDAGGLTVYPYSGEEMTLRGLHYGEKTLDIVMRGSGPYVEKLTVNGTELRALHKVPADLLREHNRIEVRRCADRPTAVLLRSAYQMAVSDWRTDGRGLSFRLSGVGRSTLVLDASGPVLVRTEDKEERLTPDGEGRIALPVILNGGRRAYRIEPDGMA